MLVRVHLKYTYILYAHVIKTLRVLTQKSNPILLIRFIYISLLFFFNIIIFIIIKFFLLPTATTFRALTTCTPKSFYIHRYIVIILLYITLTYINSLNWSLYFVCLWLVWERLINKYSIGKIANFFILN